MTRDRQHSRRLGTLYGFLAGVIPTPLSVVVAHLAFAIILGVFCRFP